MLSISGGLPYKFCWFASIVLMMILTDLSAVKSGSGSTSKRKFGTKSIASDVEVVSFDQGQCGVDDLPSSKTKRSKRYSISHKKWDHSTVTWSFRPKKTPFHSRYAHILDPKRVRTILRRALDVWAKNTNLSFKEIDSDKADILVSFGGADFDVPTPGIVDLGYAYEPGPGRGGDVHFNENVNWSLDTQSNKIGTFRLFDVAVHEFGHSLGILHSSSSNSIMNAEFRYKLSPPKYELPKDDLNAIHKLYGAPGRRKLRFRS